MDNNNIIAEEAQTLNELLRRIKKNSVYTYVLLDKIENYDERMDNKKFIAWCRIIERSTQDKTGLSFDEKIINEDSYGYPFSAEEIEADLKIEKPKPIKTFKNVDLSENSDKPELRLIHTVTEEAKKNNYELVVEKGENTANYFLYNRKEYFNFKDNLIKPLLEKCRHWNDEEYINLFTQLNAWKRKEESTEGQNLIKYFSEIKGKFDIWYMENNYNEPKLSDKILELRINYKKLIRQFLEIKSEVNQLNKDKKDLERQFENDVPDFPIDLKEKYDKIENEIGIRNKRIIKIENELVGTLEPYREGLIIKHNRWYDNFRRIAVGDDKISKELLKKSSENSMVELQQVIKNRAPEIEFTDKELLDLTITILDERPLYEEQHYKEILNEEDRNINLLKTIDKVLREKYKKVQNQPDGIVDNEGLDKGSGEENLTGIEQVADEDNKKKINLTKETEDFATELIKKKEINISDKYFVSKTKIKVFAYLNKKTTLNEKNRESIRTILSKFKTKFLAEQKQSSKKKRKKN